MADLTKKNLGEAFSGESKASQRYKAFAKKAEEDGYSNIARLFRVISESETIHAYNHLANLGGLRSTLENLDEAWKGERDEYTSMYPMFMDQAKRDADNDALKTFFWANEAEKIHSDFYEKAITAVKQGNDLELDALHVCSVCGYTLEGEPPDKCPICGKGKENFFRPE